MSEVMYCSARFEHNANDCGEDWSYYHMVFFDGKDYVVEQWDYRGSERVQATPIKWFKTLDEAIECADTVQLLVR